MKTKNRRFSTCGFVLFVLVVGFGAEPFFSAMRAFPNKFKMLGCGRTEIYDTFFYIKLRLAFVANRPKVFRHLTDEKQCTGD
jgi:hypothetical protein